MEIFDPKFQPNLKVYKKPCGIGTTILCMREFYKWVRGTDITVYSYLHNVLVHIPESQYLSPLLVLTLEGTQSLL